MDGYWLAELGPMFYSVKETGKSRSEGRKVALEHLKTMEREMKEAEEELKRRKEEAERSAEKERSAYFRYCRVSQQVWKTQKSFERVPNLLGHLSLLLLHFVTLSNPTTLIGRTVIATPGRSNPSSKQKTPHRFGI